MAGEPTPWSKTRMTSPMIRRAIPAFACIGLGAAMPAAAQTSEDRFWLEASAYMPKIDSSIQVDSPANPDIGTEIDVETDLGLDNDEALPAFLAGARLGGRWTIIGEYYAIGRDATKSLERTIVVEDVTYPVAASVTTNFDTDVYRLVIGYSFVRNDKAEAGAAIGLHATDFQIGIEGMGSVGGVSGQTEARRQDFLAPLPTVGVFAGVELAPNLRLSGRADYLSLSIGDYDGRLLNAQAKISYRVTRHVGVGVAWRHVDYRVDVEKERYEGRFKYKFSGPAVFLEAGF